MKKEKVDVVLPESAIDFLNYCKINKGLSEDTVSAYERDLRIFIQYVKIHKKQKNRNVKDIDIKKVTFKDVSNFIVYLVNELENKERTIKRKKATLDAYFSYLQNFEKLITANPMYGVVTPKPPKRQPVHLTLDESKLLLESLKKYDSNYERDYCIIVLFLHCGMRLSELENIKLKDIKGDILTIIGKGNKERSAYLDKACLEAIEKYMEVRDKYKIDDDRLFNIKKDRIQQLVKERIIKAGIEEGKKYSVHKLRHTTATLLYKCGVGITEIQQILGHESISTTQIYTHVDSDDLRQAVKKNPLNDL